MVWLALHAIMLPVDHERFMGEALAEAALAFAEGETPVGAVAVREGEIIARAHNRCESQCDPTAHAEILALREACRALGTRRLLGVTLYCTLEPCVMCAGALVHARVWALVYGADDPKAGAVVTLFDIPRSGLLNHRVQVVRGVLAVECGELITRFFAELRQSAVHNR